MDFINRLIHVLTQVHPLHPMIVHFPIALTGAGALFILVALWRRSRVLEQAAFANISLAAVSTIFAGLTGIRDNLLNYEGEAPNATFKVLLAILLLIITSAVALWRYRDPAIFEKSTARVIYTGSYLASFALAIVLAFLGGVILYGF
jgi:uncharacterized membrane protein